MFIDTPNKKRLMFSFILYFPLISLVAGTPIPLPSLMAPTAEQIAILNLISLLVTLVGTLVGATFYLERRNNLKLEKQNEKMDVIDEKIDEKAIAQHEELRELKKEMHQMEVRICDNVAARLEHIDNKNIIEIKSAKELVDTKFKHIEANQQIMRRTIQEIERGYHKSTKYSSHIDIEPEPEDEHPNG